MSIFLETKRTIGTNTLVDAQCDRCGKKFSLYLSNYRKSKRFPEVVCKGCLSTEINKKRAYPVGEKASAWKGGIYISSDGYRQINIGSGVYKREHTKVMEEFIGRSLIKGEAVHHIDGQKLNNKVENLILCNNSDHRNMHASLERVAFELFRDGVIVFDKETRSYCRK